MRSLLLLASIFSSSASQEPPVRVEAASVGRVHAAYRKQRRMVPPLYHRMGGTTSMVLLLDSPKSRIVWVSSKNSRLEQVVDDQGTSLLHDRRRMYEGFGQLPRLSEAGDKGLIELTAGKLPTGNSKFVRAKGLLDVSLAEGETRTLKSAPFVLKKGAAVAAGRLKFVVTRVRKVGAGDRLQLSLRTSQEVAEVAHFGFEDKAGKSIEVKRGWDWRSESNGKGTVTVNFTLARHVKECVLVIQGWETRRLKLPFDVKLEIETIKSEPFEAKQGSQVTVGDFSFQLADIRPPRLGSFSTQLTFKTGTDLARVARFTFEDESGKTLRSTTTNLKQSGFLQQEIKAVPTFSIRGRVDRCVMVIQAWRDKPTLKVPVLARPAR